MRIDQLNLENFKGFAKRNITLSSNFNLLIGNNGTGKTSALDALAVAAGSWFLGIRGFEAARHIRHEEVRLAAFKFEESYRFEEQYPVRVAAMGELLGTKLSWSRELHSAEGRTRYEKATKIRDLARAAEKGVRDGQPITLPLISYYGTGRLWREPRKETQVKRPNQLAKKVSRLDGYRKSIDPRLSVHELISWIARESWAGYQKGRDTETFHAVKQAILSCVEDAENLYFDPARGEVVVAMREHGPQPFANLSDGQRCMLAMVGDIAQKAAKLNPHLGSKVLLETPGIVLIDELDLHLHPRWQRRVIADLRKNFKNIQFIATTHSPQLVGEVAPTEVVILDELAGESERIDTRNPHQAFGMDSNWLLRHVMNTDDRDPKIAHDLGKVRFLISRNEFAEARVLSTKLRKRVGQHPDISSYEAIIDRYASRDK